MITLNLVFLVFIGCTHRSNDVVAIEWEGNKATGFIIPKSLLKEIEQDSLAAWLQVQMANAETRMLGDYDIHDNDVVFKPLIPFTRGLTYEITWRNKLLTAVQVPADENRLNPKVLSIYPTGKSLPENLLKIYIVFSKPMQEGKALENIAVIKNGADTVSSVFLLDLELWNKERTVLTLWLDPGRIKRELQPNQSLGLPLEAGNRYEIIIRPGWADVEGAALQEYYRKGFAVTKRDDISPRFGKWIIHPPAAGTVDPLRIELHESLDHELLINAVNIIYDHTVLKGTFETLNEESVLHFTPPAAWVAGQYTIVADPRLEDLAGNNLDRSFDTDLFTDSSNRVIKIHAKKFLIK